VYAQLVRGRSLATRAEIDRLVAGELLPALHALPGFGGALTLVGGEDVVAVVLWESAEAARHPLPPPLLAALDAASVSVWDVNGRV
jgi:hypothetical protein